MLVSHFVGLKLDDAHQGELDPPTGACQARNHPIHAERMRKPNYELFDDPVVAEVCDREVKSKSGGMFGRNCGRRARAGTKPSARPWRRCAPRSHCRRSSLARAAS
jgi:hypothetical protein